MRVTRSFFTALALALVTTLAAGTASAAPDKKKAGKGVREKYLSGEAKMKGKDQKSFDFEAADIGGQVKTPMNSLVSSGKSDKNYDFVKIRLRWHPEMVQSASSLDSGK